MKRWERCATLEIRPRSAEFAPRRGYALFRHELGPTWRCLESWQIEAHLELPQSLPPPAVWPPVWRQRGQSSECAGSPRHSATVRCSEASKSQPLHVPPLTTYYLY